jgi:argininosuccinate lyase
MRKKKKTKPELKSWAGRFTKRTNRLAEEFNASISFDRRLFSHDIRGSVVHAKVLQKAGILTRKEADRILKGLGAVEREIQSGRFKFTADLEDIHMAVEKRLIEKVGAVGGKLHTGRSRNDQVALDLRLYLKEEIQTIVGLLWELKKTLAKLARKNLGGIMPGYTHLQRAQPVLLSHHLLAYYEMFKRDGERLEDTLQRVDSMPLGSGALGGSPYNLDRRLAARLLGFSRVTENSLDAVSDRDFIIEFLSAASLIMMHLSRLSEEVIIWSTEEFGFVELSDAFSTGSSIMPQKKNPDMAELVRAKTGRVFGNLTALLTVMKALPLAYNKDMQEDKVPLFDTVDTVKGCLEVFAPMLATMKVKAERMGDAARGGFLTATDAADYLTRKGLPFRESHFVVGRVVAHCINKGKALEELTLEEWKGFSRLFERDIKRVVTAGASVSSRSVKGGTAQSAVTKRLNEIEKELRAKR